MGIAEFAMQLQRSANNKLGSKFVAVMVHLTQH